MDQSTGPPLNATPPMQNRLLIGPPAVKLDSAASLRSSSVLLSCRLFLPGVDRVAAHQSRWAFTKGDDMPKLSLDEFRRYGFAMLGACPSICLCSRIAPGFRWALAFSATAPALGAHYPPLNSSRRCRSGAKSSEDCGSSRSVATRPTPSPVLVTKTCGFPARI